MRRCTGNDIDLQYQYIFTQKGNEYKEKNIIWGISFDLTPNYIKHEKCQANSEEN